MPKSRLVPDETVYVKSLKRFHLLKRLYKGSLDIETLCRSLEKRMVRNHLKIKTLLKLVVFLRKTLIFASMKFKEDTSTL